MFPYFALGGLFIHINHILYDISRLSLLFLYVKAFGTQIVDQKSHFCLKCSNWSRSGSN